MSAGIGQASSNSIYSYVSYLHCVYIFLSNLANSWVGVCLPLLVLTSVTLQTAVTSAEVVVSCYLNLPFQSTQKKELITELKSMVFRNSHSLVWHPPPQKIILSLSFGSISTTLCFIPLL